MPRRLPFLMLTLLGGGTVTTAAAAYDARVMATSPLRYNKLNETSGTAIVDSSGNAYTGTYTGVDLANTDSPFLPDKAPLWDGTNDYGAIYSAAFATAFSFDEITIMLWAKVSAAAVWTDGVDRYLFRIRRDASNFFSMHRTTTNNTIEMVRAGGATTKTVTAGSQSDTGWVCYAISASIAGGGLLTAGDMRVYKNGTQLGTTQTGNISGASGVLSSTQTALGAVSTTPAQVWSGWQSRLMIWNRPIDAAILALMTA